MRRKMETKPFLYMLAMLAAAAMVMTMLSGGAALAAVQTETTGCAVSPVKNYGEGGFDETEFNLANIYTDENNDFYLETGAQQVNPDRIIIPFDQEVFATFISEGAGYESDFGYVKLEDVVEKDDDGNILYKKQEEVTTSLISGGGSDIWGGSDEFHYQYHEQDGDFDVRLKLHSLENTNGWAKAGLMVREDLDDDSQHAMMVVSPGNGYSFQYRDSEGGSSSNGGKEGSASYPSWVRLVRNGDTVTGYWSANGTSWNQVGSHTFPSGGGKFSTNNVHLGIAITSHNSGTLCTAEVSDYEIVGETAPSFTGIDIGSPSPAGGYQESGSYTWVYAPYNADEDELYARDAYGMLIEKFIGWENVPDEDKQPIFVETNGGTVLDSSAHLPGYSSRPNTESALRTWEDGTGLYFIPNGDGSVNEKDMRKSLGTFEAGTELVFFLSADHHYNEADSGSLLTYFTKEDWNPDTYDSTVPAADSDWCLETSGGNCVRFNKRYQLGVSGGEQWRIDAGWMTTTSINSLKNNWGVELDENDEYIMEITDGQKYEHVIVGAPADDPNQWILGFEDLKGGGDTDHNDVVFRIERKTGGEAELKLDNAIPASASGDESVYYTGVTFETWDYMPCDGKTWINYEVSIDGGTTWVEIPNSDWDVVKCWSESSGVGGAVDDWTPGTSDPRCTNSSSDPSPYTYRKKRIDFSSMGMIGQELLWKATFESENENCMPKILNVNLEGSVARHAFFSRASPVAQANVMYSGNYETPDPSDSEWIQEPTLRGHVIATQLYDPANPSGGASTSELWDAGQALADMSVANRNIYFPDVSATYVDSESLTLNKEDGKTFTGTLSNTNLSAGTLLIVMTVDGEIELFRDKFTNELSGDRRGIGSINRFTGDFEIILASAVADDAVVDDASASYVYLTYSGSSTLKTFTSSNLDKDLLGMNHRYPFSKTDFNNDGTIDDTDRDLLIDWVRGKNLDGTEKAWPLGPVDHSMPALETPPGNPAWLYGTAVSDDQKNSYIDFRGLKAGESDTIAETLQARRSVLYVGSRGGMLHAFDAGDFRWGNNPDTAGVEEKRGYFKDGNYGDGSELWAFIPGSLLSKMKNNLLKEEDQAFVDASPTVADIYDGSDWKTVVLSALGNGGDSVFCLDVTNPDSPQFMWEYTHPDLFRSRSSPSVAAVGQIVDANGNPKWAAFFVSGEVADDEYPTIFVIDVATGSSISMTNSNGNSIDKIVLNADSDGKGGIASGQPAMVDSDFNGYVDRLYIGTDKGNMYKVNIPDDPESASGRVSHCVINSDTETDGGDSVDTGDVGNPIYGSPAVVVDNSIASDGSISYNIRVFFGTGDSPYADENINTAETNYHFFAYLDQDDKGACGDAKLDWLYTLPAGERVWASAFASAGQIYFGTTTAETEDPCEGYQEGADTGSLYAVDQKLEEGASLSPVQTDVGDNINVSPVTTDEHVFVKKPSGEVDVIGDGEFNNEVKGKGRGQSKVLLWREVQTY